MFTLFGRKRYLWLVSKCLPTGDFKWVDNLDNFDIMNISDKSPKG